MGSSKPIRPTGVSGTTALDICESPLLALGDRDIVPDAEIVGVLKDEAAALIDGNSARLR